MFSDNDNEKRFILSERRECGEHKMAVGGNGNYLCAFCSGVLITLSNNSYGCFGCSCKYHDYTDSINELIDNDEDITISEIAEQLNVDVKYISGYVKECGVQLGKGKARICPTCGSVIMDGGDCKRCAISTMKREMGYNNVKTKKRKKAVGTSNKTGMHYVGRNKPQIKRGS